MNIGIIGGGKGGASIIRGFSGIEGFYILGICDTNDKAPGIALARERAIPVFSKLEELLALPGLEVVIEATGSPKVREAIQEKKQPQTVVADSQVANVMMTLIEAREEMFKKMHNEIVAFRTAAPYLTETFEGGVVYFTTDLEKYDFVLNRELDIPGVKVGEKLVEDGFIRRCIQSQRDITGTVDKSVYGMRLKIRVFPVFADDDSSKVVGTCGIFLPKVHPIAKAFKDFAPVLANSFPEGAVILATDTERIIDKQGSEKFDIPAIQVGTKLRDNDAAPRSMRARSRVVINVDARAFGVPCQIISIPLFDDESGDVVGAFGLIFPRALAENLREMAAKLQASTQEMARVMEEIAASANEINLNETHLAENVQEVQGISSQINDILNFIKGVADQTKMLGLNAAIEAARAGEHGRGFGVVAEEIRKLSDQSKETAEQIRKLTREIDNKIAAVTQASEGSVKQSQEQAAATQQVNASVMEIAVLAEKLAELANNL
ncbi:MAG: methyl-accepting chemotaxis protein [Syntrophomonadaceae bacterium]|nr:methyl-accepting chemotaxis protein [Syntrophomonadaceae bacterium]